ncbi:MAG: helix-turn-helix domain-containing protein [Propioniciclava sp.]
MSTDLTSRAQAYAALGEPSRLAIIDLLGSGDLASGDLASRLGLPTNLIAHHLQVLEQSGLITRRRSEGDARRSYVRRTPACDRLLGTPGAPPPSRVAFVCSQNSARSQIAEAYWRTVSEIPVVSAGTHAAETVHPCALRVAHRHGLDLSGARPKLMADVLNGDELLIAVCDRAHEDLQVPAEHWSIPDPARSGDTGAFEAAYTDITDRIDHLTHRFAGGPT